MDIVLTLPPRNLLLVFFESISSFNPASIAPNLGRPLNHRCKFLVQVRPKKLLPYVLGGML